MRRSGVRQARGLQSLSFPCALLFLLLGPAQVGEARPDRWGSDYFPNVSLVNHEGEKVRFFEDLLEGKVVAINFIFTRCGKVCPAETARLRKVQELLGERVGKDVFFYSISVDPENDTPEALKAYREKFGIAPGWDFFTGKEEEITLIQQRLGLLVDELDDPQDHDISLIVGNQSTGQWVKRSPFDNPKVLANLIGNQLHGRKLAHAERRKTYAQAARLDNFTRGEYLFRSRCATCHSVGKGEGLGPDLLGVTRKRERAWLVRWLKEPDLMLEEEDPVAMAMFRRYGELSMPNLGLNDLEAGALIEYMAAESVRVEQAAPPRADGPPLSPADLPARASVQNR